MLRRLQCLCCSRLAGLAAFRSQLPSSSAAPRLSRSKTRPAQHSRKVQQVAASSAAAGLAIFSRPPASELVTPQTVAAPALRELGEQLGPFDTAPSVPPPAPLVIIISGPSGVGKDAVINRLRARRPDIYFVVTATSR